MPFFKVFTKMNILAEFSKKKNAQDFEKMLIAQLKPKYNGKHYNY